MMPAIPPLIIFGMIENVFWWVLFIESLASVAPAIAIEGMLSVVAAAEMPGGMDWMIWQF